MTPVQLARSVLTLVASLVLALAPLLLTAETWADLATPTGVGTLAGPAAGVVLAWIGERPRRLDRASR